jgi:hypothetical protein
MKEYCTSLVQHPQSIGLKQEEELMNYTLTTSIAPGQENKSTSH